MKNYNVIYYLLFILLVMGAFASMAQNSYGLKIMGGVACVFGVVFLIEFINSLHSPVNNDRYTPLESLCLSLLSFIFACRIFYIHFPYVELLFAAASILLIVLYARKMIIRYNEILPQNRLLAYMTVIFHVSIILFLFSLVMIAFAPKIADPRKWLKAESERG